ncbi:saccharopine dehydrogenase family protein [Nocardia nova SH22a]|uniref:Saccharopine dehydrogenase family protein n=1 Tax=Nocardia nova SH22a TaxID=1415166 RepID=W5TML4_9NOCA|nr:saccharopine dehydrogenase NADP-binding domain-containing protein [Nocardia nova]AHH18471.1 saccharopine dehydrogenase family protein [Nocardia nova SH22a]
MTERTQNRAFDVVLFGATGFTGGLTADYLAGHLPPGARWALAGRDRSRLVGIGKQLLRDHPSVQPPELIDADVSNPDSLRAMAESTKVVITTVGPYLEYGDPVVAACAAAGTDYVDLTGEPEFVDRTYLAHHSTAVRTGARLVHACGFDSIPHDLGVLFTVRQLPAGVPLTVRGVARSNAMFSGGTLHSGLAQMSRLRQMRRAAVDRRRFEPRPTDGRRARARFALPRRDGELGVWVVGLPTIDGTIVQRSASARADYGPDFTYYHCGGVEHLATVVGAAVGAAAFLGAVQVPPLRRLIGARVPQGTGPSEERRARSWFTVDFVGEGGGRTVRTRVGGGDPGYTETSKMLAHAAMCLAFDDNPPTAGQVTTAAAMGDNLMRRLIGADMSFAVL